VVRRRRMLFTIRTKQLKDIMRLKIGKPTSKADIANMLTREQGRLGYKGRFLWWPVIISGELRWLEYGSYIERLKSEKTELVFGRFYVKPIWIKFTWDDEEMGKYRGYYNRDGKSFNKVLIRLAQISPPSYARDIRDRNTELLAIAEKYESRIGTCLTSGAKFKVPYGCPHCGVVCANTIGAFKCLWAQAGAKQVSYDNKSAFCCCYVSYPSGCIFNDVAVNRENNALGISYGADIAFIVTSVYHTILTRECYDNVVNFLKDHIDWANLDCWGVDYHG